MTGRPVTAGQSAGPRGAGGRPAGDLASGDTVGVEGRELAALVDGPWVGCWYWRDDLEAQQATAHDMHARERGRAELGTKAHYRPTDTWTTSPDGATRGRG